MKISRLFISLILIGGLVFMVSTNSMASTNFTLEKESIKNVVDRNRHGKGLTLDGYLEIVSKVKLRNNSDKPLDFDVTVTFVNSEKDKLGEATETFRIEPGESKKVSNLILLDSNTANQIDSGYVTIINP